MNSRSRNSEDFFASAVDLLEGADVEVTGLILAPNPGQGLFQNDLNFSYFVTYRNVSMALSTLIEKFKL